MSAKTSKVLLVYPDRDLFLKSLSTFYFFFFRFYDSNLLIQTFMTLDGDLDLFQLSRFRLGRTMGMARRGVNKKQDVNVVSLV